MRAVVIDKPGGPGVLNWREVPDPVPSQGEVVIEIAASAVNRADLLQRQGFYPPPPGAPPYLGLECGGRIASPGGRWQIGDQVCALLAGGGYAEAVAVPAEQVLPVPHGLSTVEAAALPEAACTVWSMVFMEAGLTKGETLLVHGGASGIGTFAIQLARAYGCRVAATAGSPEKLERCRELGADVLINYREQDFADVVKADVILDIMGGKYLQRNVKSLTIGGRLVVIGLQGGAKGELDLGTLLSKRASVHAAGLRARSVAEKAAIVESVRENVWPLVEAGAVKPVVHTTVPMGEAARAHRILEASEHVGKVVLVA